MQPTFFGYLLPHRFLAICAILIGISAQPTLASEKEAKKEGGEKKAEHGGEGGAAPTSQIKRMPGGYVHNWVNFPSLSGKSIFSEEQVQVQPEKGFVSVVIFMASWCERCQRLVGAFEQLRTEFKDLPVRVTYVFSHDTMTDAQGFSKEHKMLGQAVLSNHDILKDFHNPPLPSIYLGDRHGWLLQRYLDAEVKDIAETRKLLKMMTAI